MSDSDDQDKTRIQPRQQKPSVGRSPAGVNRPPPANQARPKKTEEAKTLERSANSTVFSAQEKAQKRSAAMKAASAGARVQQKLRESDPTVAESPKKLSATKAGASKSLHAHDVLKGRFILERVLGAGGMGVVYKAKDLLKVEAKDRDPYVAIKVLGEEFKSHPEAFIALQRESRKTQRIAHPNIVNVHDFDKDGDTVFMTMEYLEGTPLDKLIKKYRSTGLPLTDVWQILGGLCSALAYAHDQKIIHSDLKPGNIFVTNQTLAKVFDFGIARAVAKAEQGEIDTEDKTVFDAGNLGALTPAYASLEMLEGDPPDVRDDIYALGCIAYELFTGEHPYQRKNAKEAKREGLKPARISDITKHQWRIIEQAIAFKREDRIGSVKEFWSALTKKYSRPYMLWTTLLLISVIAGAVVYDRVYRDRPPQQPLISEAEFRTELEYKIRLELIQENIAKFLKNPVFDARWESGIWQQVQNLMKLLGETDAGVIDTMAQVYQLYLAQISKDMEAHQFELAGTHIQNGRRYTSDQTELDSMRQALELALDAERKLKAAEEEKQRNAQQQRIVTQQQQQEEARLRKEYDLALANINEQLQCNSLLNMGDLAISVNKLRSIDMAFYKKEEGAIVTGLAKCIQRLGRNFPDRAQASLTAALALFDNNPTLRNLRLEKKDSCGVSLAGLGTRGRRTMCQDDLSYGGRGPDLVVIPGVGNIKAFALGKYEVSAEEFNQYCQVTRVCDVPFDSNLSLPITRITLQMAQDYITWLSKESGKIYRLPTLEEWTLAARAKGRGLDSNRNCYLDSRGLQKGGALISAGIGQQNGWGLVNYVGNAREWVTAGGGQIYVVGGSYKTDMDQCDLNWKRSSDGAADVETGFRVLRELTK